MKTITTMIMVMLLSGYYNLTNAQQLSEIKIGDYVPDIPIEKIINFEKTNAKMSDFKGKWLILDFWFTSCSPCIKGFPRMDTLQKKFGNDIVILPVTWEDENKVQEVLNSLPGLKEYKVPSIVENKTLKILFPHSTVPTEVIIDPQGKVVAITAVESLNEKSIQSLIDKKEVQFFEKKTNADLSVSSYTPLFLKKIGTDLHYYNILTGAIEGLHTGSGIEKDKNGRDTSFYATNALIIDLIIASELGCNCGVDILPMNRIVYNTRDNSRFFIPKRDTMPPVEFRKLAYSRTYCYNIVVPQAKYKTMYPLMKKQVEDFFDIKYGLVKKKVDTYVITKIDTVRLKALKRKRAVSDIEFKTWTLKSIGWRYFMEFMNNESAIPILSDIQTEMKIDLSFIPDFKDFTKLQTALAATGITIQKQKRNLDILVVNDK